MDYKKGGKGMVSRAWANLPAFNQSTASPTASAS